MVYSPDSTPGDRMVYAYKLNRRFSTTLAAHKMRFRGNNSVSLISLNQSTPLLGTSALSLAQLQVLHENNIDKFLKQHKPAKPPGRPTPEKQLESYILLQDLENGQSPFDPQILILTDERAIKDERGKVVLDLLGFNTSTGSLVLIELKSTRAAMELQKQLILAEQVISSRFDEYHRRLLHCGFEWKDSGRIEKIAIWPCPTFGKRVNQFKENNIREICYKEKGELFSFFEEN